MLNAVCAQMNRLIQFDCFFLFRSVEIDDVVVAANYLMKSHSHAKLRTI